MRNGEKKVLQGKVKKIKQKPSVIETDFPTELNVSA